MNNQRNPFAFVDLTLEDDDYEDADTQDLFTSSFGGPTIRPTATWDLGEHVITPTSTSELETQVITPAHTGMRELETKLVTSANAVTHSHSDTARHAIASNQDISDMETQVVDSRTSNADLETQLIGSSTRFADLETQVIGSGTSFADMETQVIGSGTSFADMETQVIGSGTSFADMETQVIGSSSADLETQVIGSSSADLETQVIGSSIADLETQVIGSSIALETQVLDERDQKAEKLDSGQSRTESSQSVVEDSKEKRTEKLVEGVPEALVSVEKSGQAELSLDTRSDKEKVIEIFQAAGRAFTQLGELTMLLKEDIDEAGAPKHQEEWNQLHSSISALQDDVEQLQANRKRKAIANTLRHQHPSVTPTWMTRSSLAIAAGRAGSAQLTTGPLQSPASGEVMHSFGSTLNQPRVFAKKSKPNILKRI